MRSLLLIAFILLATCGWAQEAPLQVLVSIPPQKFLVERVAGTDVSVLVLVPPGASPHHYEPPLRQMLEIQQAKVWFRMGESFENRILPSLQGSMDIVDQRAAVPLLPSGCHCGDAHDACDPHIWLSPKLLILMAKQITTTLIQHMPEHAGLYTENLRTLTQEIETLDATIARTLAPIEPKILLASHPAFAYFCQDYGFTQLSIEMEGREPTPRYLTELLQQARQQKVRTLLLQMQYNPKGATRIAKELGLQPIPLDPYAENVLETLQALTKALVFP